jgi:hypothetical protein
MHKDWIENYALFPILSFREGAITESCYEQSILSFCLTGNTPAPSEKPERRAK